MAETTALIGWALVAVTAAWTLRRAYVGAAPEPTPLAWYGALLLALVALRWPAATVGYELNPDEGQSLAGALTLWADPRFWISVDGATAGPVHFFALMPVALAPGTAAFTLSRVLAAVLVFGALAMVGRVVASFASALAEQLLLIPAVVAFALTRDPNFQHYSTEVVASFLIATGLTLQQAGNGEMTSSRARAWISGAMLGLVPWTKLQAAPIALAIGVLLVMHHGRARRWPCVSGLLIGALVPTLLVASYLSLAGAWQDALVPYFFNNLAYVANTGWTARESISELLRQFAREHVCAGWFVTALGLTALAACFPAVRRHFSRRHVILASVWLAITAACIVTPHRPFLHYLILAITPTTLVVGCAIGAMWRAAADQSPSIRLSIAAGCLGIFIVPLAGFRYLTADASAPIRTWYAEQAVTNAAIVDTMRSYRHPHDSLAVWGTNSPPYVLAGLRQAVPEAHSETQMQRGPWQGYFLGRFLQGMDTNRPAFFLDAVGPRTFMGFKGAPAHEKFAPLGDLIRRNYSLVAEINGIRVFVRNERLTKSGLASQIETSQRRTDP